ncbi:cell division suppressor protein YneA [Oxobacter pfennigii]|uniref:Cell division suppressor protein YneA n=1 Tax=Oxobacter pfennigii TaxID=36849 RepID=A0A0P8W832_9CLOT|nr:LysM peptidoglycan-binding domain-containing protein [Oxobacter pfennigii]KPU44838.1 cell division suppressor protein YneA [Oxobacter pfennigii]
MKRSARRRKAFNRFIVLLISSFMLFTFIITLRVHGNAKVEYATITVEKGDTLWYIVKKNCENYKDIRKAIYDIKKVNNLTSSNIIWGQEIKIPLKMLKQDVK